MGWLWFGLFVSAVSALMMFIQSIIRSMRWPEPKPRPYICPECCDSFQTNDVLIMHVRSQHHEQFGPLKARLEAVAKERKAKQKRSKRAKLKLVP